jgi:hypothetical protein
LVGGNKLDPWRRKNDCFLRYAKLYVACGDRFFGAAWAEKFRLWRKHGGDPQVLEQLREVNAARRAACRVNVSNGLCVNQRPLESLHRRDIRLGSSGSNENGHPDTRNFCVIAPDFAGSLKARGHLWGCHYNVDILEAFR